MNLIKNKKADVAEATGITLGEIIGWIVLFALALFVYFWYSGLGTKIITMLKTLLK